MADPNKVSEKIQWKDVRFYGTMVAGGMMSLFLVKMMCGHIEIMKNMDIEMKKCDLMRNDYVRDTSFDIHPKSVTEDKKPASGMYDAERKRLDINEAYKALKSKVW